MDFPKKQAQRLMPLYLLEYSEKLFTNHPNPEAPWGGGGGSDYTAGQGITITNNEISVDTNVIATKSDITQMVTTTQLNDALDDYALKTEIPTDVSQLTNDAGYATQTWVENKGYSTFSGNYNDLTNKPDLSIYAESSNLATVATSGSYNDLIDKPTIPDTTNFVTTNTVQTISETKYFDAGNLVVERNSPIPMKLAFMPEKFMYYTDSNNRTNFYLPTSKPSGNADNPAEYTFAMTDDIHNPTITFTQGGVTKGTITLNQSNDQIIAFDDGAQPDCPFLNVSDPQNQMYFSLDGSEFSWSRYIDLSAVGHQFYVNLSALNPVFKDGLTSTFNDTTNQLEVGLSAPMPDTSKFVTTDTEQAITGIKTFAHTPNNITDAGIKIDMYDAAKTIAAVEFNTYGTGDWQNWCLAGFNGDLIIRQISGSGDFAISSSGIIPRNINSANLGNSSKRWNNLYLAGDLSDGTNSVKVADIATKADIPTVPTTATSTSTLTPTTTELVFTYADNTTETITLMTAATVSTTTTLS